MVIINKENKPICSLNYNKLLFAGRENECLGRKYLPTICKLYPIYAI